MAAGNPTHDLWWAVGVFAIVGAAWLLTGGPERTPADVSPFIRSPFEPRGSDAGASANRYSWQSSRDNVLAGSGDWTGASGEIPASARSPYYGQFSLWDGNAKWEYRPGQEYLTLRASHDLTAPVAISGWTLVSDKSGARPTYSGGRLYYPSGRSIAIPNAAGPIVLAANQEAVLISGVPLKRSGNPITASFRVNKCVGYLADAYDTVELLGPAANWRCPDPASEPGNRQIDRACYEFVERMPDCHVPEFNNPSDEPSNVDGVTGLSRVCKDFLAEHYNYAGCLKYHATDPDFLTDEWRVYLGSGWELWSDRDESITLYDHTGLIVDQLSY